MSHSVFEGCTCHLQIVTGEFLEKKKKKKVGPQKVFQWSCKHGCPACPCQALVALSRENMTNLHSNVVRKAHRGLGLLDLGRKYLSRKVAFSRPSQSMSKRTFKVLFGVFVIKVGRSIRKSVLINDGIDVQFWRGHVKLLTRRCLTSAPVSRTSAVQLCAPHSFTHPCRVRRDPFVDLWSDISFQRAGVMGFQWTGLLQILSHTLVEYKRFTLSSKTQREGFN